MAVPDLANRFLTPELTARIEATAMLMRSGRSTKRPKRDYTAAVDGMEDIAAAHRELRAAVAGADSVDMEPYIPFIAAHPDPDVGAGRKKPDEYGWMTWLRAGAYRAGLMALHGMARVVNLMQRAVPVDDTAPAETEGFLGFLRAQEEAANMARKYLSAPPKRAPGEEVLAPAVMPGDQPVTEEPPYEPGTVAQSAYEFWMDRLLSGDEEPLVPTNLIQYSREHPWKTAGGEALAFVPLLATTASLYPIAAGAGGMLAASVGMSEAAGAYLATSSLALGEVALTAPGSAREVVEDLPAYAATTFAIGGAALAIPRAARRLTQNFVKSSVRRSLLENLPEITRQISGKVAERASRQPEFAKAFSRAVVEKLEWRTPEWKEAAARAIASGSEDAASYINDAISDLATHKARQIAEAAGKWKARFGRRIKRAELRAVGTMLADAELRLRSAGIDADLGVDFVERAFQLTEDEIDAFRRAYGREPAPGQKLRGKVVIEDDLEQIDDDIVMPMLRAKISLALTGRPGDVVRTHVHEMAHIYVKMMQRFAPEEFQSLVSDIAERLSFLSGAKIDPSTLSDEAVAEHMVRLLSLGTYTGFGSVADGRVAAHRASKLYAHSAGLKQFMSRFVSDSASMAAEILGFSEDSLQRLRKHVSDFANLSWDDIFASRRAMQARGEDPASTAVHFLADDASVGEPANISGLPMEVKKAIQESRFTERGAAIRSFNPADVIEVDVSNGKMRVPVVRGAPEHLVVGLKEHDLEARARAVARIIIDAEKSGENAHPVVRKAIDALNWYRNSAKGQKELVQAIRRSVEGIVAKLRTDGITVGENLLKLEEAVSLSRIDEIANENVMYSIVGMSAARRSPLQNAKIAVRYIGQLIGREGRPAPMVGEISDIARAVYGAASVAIRGSRGEVAYTEVEAEKAIKLLVEATGDRDLAHILSLGPGHELYPRDGESFISWIRRVRFGGGSRLKLPEYTESFVRYGKEGAAPLTAEASDPALEACYVCDTWEAQAHLPLPEGQTRTINEVFRLLAEGRYDDAVAARSRFRNWDNKRTAKKTKATVALKKLLAYLEKKNKLAAQDVQEALRKAKNEVADVRARIAKARKDGNAKEVERLKKKLDAIRERVASGKVFRRAKTLSNIAKKGEFQQKVRYEVIDEGGTRTEEMVFSAAPESIGELLWNIIAVADKPYARDHRMPGSEMSIGITKEFYETARNVVNAVTERANQFLREAGINRKVLPGELQGLVWWVVGGGAGDGTALGDAASISDIARQLMARNPATGLSELEELLARGIVEGQRSKAIEKYMVPVELATATGAGEWSELSKILGDYLATTKQGAQRLVRLITGRNLLKNFNRWFGALAADAAPGVGYWAGEKTPNAVVLTRATNEAAEGIAHAYGAARVQAAVFASRVDEVIPRAIASDSDLVGAAGVYIEFSPGKRASTPWSASDIADAICKKAKENGAPIDGGTVVMEGGKAKIYLGITDDGLNKLREASPEDFVDRVNRMLNAVDEVMGGISDRAEYESGVYAGDVYYQDFSPHSMPETIGEAKEAYAGDKPAMEFWKEMQEILRRKNDAATPEDKAKARADEEVFRAAWHAREAIKRAPKEKRGQVVRDLILSWRSLYNVPRNIIEQLKASRSAVDSFIGEASSFYSELSKNGTHVLKRLGTTSEAFDIIKKLDPGLMTGDLMGIVTDTLAEAQKEAGKKISAVSKKFSDAAESALDFLGAASRQTQKEAREWAVFFEAEESGDEAFSRAAEEAAKAAGREGDEVEAMAAAKAQAESMRAASRSPEQPKTAPTEEIDADHVAPEALSPSVRWGVIDTMRAALRSIFTDRFALLDAVDPEAANRLALWASAGTRARVWARRSAQYVTSVAKDEDEVSLFVRYAWHVRREAILAAGNVSEDEIKLPALSPTELEAVRTNPRIQEMVRRWKEVWSEITAMRRALGLKSEQKVENDFFASLIPYREEIHGKEAKVWRPGSPSPPGAAVPKKFNVRSTKFRLEAKGTAEAYLIDPEDILYHSMATDVIPYEQRRTIEYLKKAGLALSKKPEGTFTDARGKEHHWKEVVVRLPHSIYREFEELDRGIWLGVPGESYWMPEPLARAWEDLVLNNPNRIYRSWQDNPLFAAWSTFTDKMTGLMLASFVEAAAHSQRILERLAAIPPVGEKAPIRLAELLVPYLGPRAGAMWRIITSYASPDAPLLEKVMARVGAFPSRSVANEAPLLEGPGKAGKIALKALHAGRGFLFDMPEGFGPGVWGFDVRARLAALRIWYEHARASGRLGNMTLEDLATKPSPFDAEIRDFLSAFGSFNNNVQGHLIKLLKNTRLLPFAASQAGMRPAEILGLFGKGGLKGASGADRALLLAETFYRNTAGPIAFLTLANKALSGHWPWENEPGKELFLDTGLKDSDGAPIYISPRLLYPGLYRALRTVGVKDLIDPRKGRGLKQRLEALPMRALNEALGTISGPGVRSIMVGLTGRAPYLASDWTPMRISRVELDPVKQAVANLKTAIATANPNIEGVLEDWVGTHYEFHSPLLKAIVTGSQFLVGKVLEKGKPPAIAGGETLRYSRTKLDEYARFKANRVVDLFLAGKTKEAMEEINSAAKDIAKFGGDPTMMAKSLRKILMAPKARLRGAARARAIEQILDYQEAMKKKGKEK